MQTLYLIRGLPGAGKSKLAYSIHHHLPKSVVIKADQYFLDEDSYYNFDSSKLHRAHKRCQNDTIIYLMRGYDVIVSNTSTTEKEVKVYQDLASIIL